MQPPSIRHCRTSPLKPLTAHDKLYTPVEFISKCNRKNLSTKYVGTHTYTHTRAEYTINEIKREPWDMHTYSESKTAITMFTVFAFFFFLTNYLT